MVEVYDSSSNVWLQDTPIPVPLCTPNIVLNDKIYIYGGVCTTHPNCGTSTIYEFTNKDIFAVTPVVDKTFVPENDTVALYTRFRNVNQHQFTPYLKFTNLDNTQMDSTLLFDDGLHGDSLAGDGLYGASVISWLSEDFFSLGISTIDNETSVYYNTSDRCRFTSAGPVLLDSIIFLKGLTDFYWVKPFFHNDGPTLTITGVKVRLLCNDPWSTSMGIVRDYPDMPPGVTVGFDVWFPQNYIDSLFPGYFNLNFEIISNEWKYWNASTNLTVGIKERIQNPYLFELQQNYPNPFNPSTRISWYSPSSGIQLLKVYNILGEEVVTLLNEYRSSGKYNITFDAGRNALNLASGIYLYRLRVVDPTNQKVIFEQTRKMTLIK